MENTELKIRDFTTNRKLQMLKIEEIIKDAKKMDMEQLLSKIEYETGLIRKKAREMMMILYDIKKINIEKGLVEWLEGEKVKKNDDKPK